MTDDMVMRSVYLRPLQDTQLRQLARTLDVTKSDLIRAAISMKLLEWLQSNDREKLLEDVAHGLRDEEAIRSGRRGRRPAEPVKRPAEHVVVKPSRGSKAAEASADNPDIVRDALV